MRQRAERSVVVFELAGRLVVGDGEGRLTDAVRVCLQAGRRHILLNCSELTHVDSSGLGEIVESYVAVAGVGGRLALSGLSRRLRVLLATVGLLGILDVHEHEEEGLSSLRGETTAPRPSARVDDSTSARAAAASEQPGVAWHRHAAAFLPA